MKKLAIVLYSKTVLPTAAFLIALLSTTVLPILMNPPSALAYTDTYPTSIAGCKAVNPPPTGTYTCDLKDDAQDSDFDPWSEENRECVSYVAWMLSSVNGFTMPFHGNAIDWGSKAQGLGYAVNMTPAVGSVYWSNAGQYGHVAYVQSVSSDGTHVDTTDYNSDYTGHWNQELNVLASSASGYIHFKDITGSGSNATAKPAPIQYGTEMDVYKRGGDNAIWKDTIQSGSNSWGGWNSLGGTFASNPAADQYGSEMDVFATNASGQLYQRTYQSSSGWSSWTQRASNMAGDPASIAFNGKLYVFSRGTNGNLYVVYWNGSTWVGPQQLTGNGSTQMGSSPSVTVYGSEMDVYIRGTDSNLWKSGTSDGVNFGSLGSMGGGTLENDPKAITYGTEMDVYANNTSGTLTKDTWNGNSWSGWNTLTGASFTGSPTALQYGSGEMDVYDRGISDSYIYQDTWQAGGTSWSGWMNRGGNEAGDPSALQWGTEMDVYATNYKNYTDKDTWNGSTWSGFLALL